eukprot:61606-Chlamydomonas_euryale.AAC.2
MPRGGAAAAAAAAAAAVALPSPSHSCERSRSPPPTSTREWSFAKWCWPPGEAWWRKRFRCTTSTCGGRRTCHRGGKGGW